MRNAESYIAQTLESILRQDWVSLDIVVVDDRSTDASLKAVSRISDERIRVFEGPGRGAAAAMNVGLAHAHGTIVMHCDADDLYPAQRIQRQVAWLRDHPGYAAVCGSFSTI